MPDAPSRFTIRQVRAAHSSEYALDEAIADALVAIPLPTRTHSRRSSTGSGWSSGMDLTIPDSEPDSGGDSEPDAPAPALAAPRVCLYLHQIYNYLCHRCVDRNLKRSRPLNKRRQISRYVVSTAAIVPH